MTPTKEQRWAMFEKLPKELKHAIFSEETAGAIEQIAQKNDLNNIQSSDLAKEIGDVLLGLLEPEVFEDRVTKKINEEVNHLIFLPVQAQLNQVYQIKKEQAQKQVWQKPVEKPAQENGSNDEEYPEKKEKTIDPYKETF
ncbi:hypothetical protein COX24_01145 [bacterium (Candidatus Gribaldobacteria) CG23_combo_of_CG06-09_8_20_14_all_37_87_8]|uniref:Uncharacterized protein n=2 Tax=Candidatus Gribaldobacteria TaxID=2798536 RepID=A0A2G9ZFD4_9BACT|nr:MAG: hypothetical protein COX24_01145 [bacterium (Candidatus Gribaldobacteria) CG23_combo_of_CG06-09_8_20_14_all_37_87_8]PIR90218.1 MAG: hypothetical protein COU05_02965 [bacterium (Candidatus Gribaldobacteria) CG10_big_fil_rev_8_21_14_0_10_37_21]